MLVFIVFCVYCRKKLAFKKYNECLLDRDKNKCVYKNGIDLCIINHITVQIFGRIVVWQVRKCKNAQWRKVTIRSPLIVFTTE